MARLKNAFTKHEIQPMTAADYTEGEWLTLARHILTAEPDTNEETTEEGFYDGDGTPETNVDSVAVGYSFEGYKNLEDPAQALILGMEFESGEARKVWYRRTDADGSVAHVGPATVSGIVNGGGEAVAYEQFACNIRWDKKPIEETPGIEGE